MSMDDFEARYPDVDTTGWEKSQYSNGWLSERTIRVAEYWWKEKNNVTMHKVLRGGNPVIVQDHELLEGDQVIESKNVEKDKILHGKMVHDQFVEGPFDDWPVDCFPIIFQGGEYKFVEGLVRYHGKVRFARDPQQMYNYWTSTITEQVALQPKSPYIVSANNVKNFKNIWDTANTKNYPYLPIDIDPSGFTPQRQPAPQVSSAYANELDRLNNDIMSTMGVYEASLGAQGPEVSGIAIEARQRQGSQSSSNYIYNFRLSLYRSTKLIIDLIPHVIDTMRQVRILGPDQKDKVVFVNSTPDQILQLGLTPEDKEMHLIGADGMVNNMSAGKYDVIITVGPSNYSQRQENADMMINLLQTMPNMADVIAPILIKNIDNPATREISEMLEAQKEQPPQPDPLVELANKDQMLKAKELELKAFKEAQQLELNSQKNEIEELKVMVDILKNNQTAEQYNQMEKGLGLDGQQS